MTKANFGVVGMAVMGRNLALNIESRGYTVAIYNRSKEKTEDVIACHPEKNFVPSYDVFCFFFTTVVNGNCITTRFDI